MVITTINPVTPAVALFETQADWKMVLVGDRKSPPIADTERLTFLSMATQLELGMALGSASPVNHYARKNIGYLHAIGQGAQVIYDTDDDNIPYEHWQLPSHFNCDTLAGSPSGFVNIYRHFTAEHIWPRGFPLDEILDSRMTYTLDCPVEIGVWQGLADADPDVDAIWRLTLNKDITFNNSAPVGIRAGNYCPFNSQNTFWRQAVFPLLYLPTTVRFRFTDILRGYIAQRLMRENALYLGFMAASVRQERNPHDYLEDFKDETDCYLHIKPIVRLLDSLALSGEYHQDLRTTYHALSQEGFVAASEMTTLEAWLNDLTSIAGHNHG
jgi:hypothetical protein